MNKHVIIGSNNQHQLQVFGTRYGRVFLSEAAATRMVSRLENSGKYNHLDWLVMPIEHAPSTENWQDYYGD